MTRITAVDKAAERLVALYSAQGMTCATAESCTGGGVGFAITSAAGASAVFKGGAITYANEAKRSVLGVQGATLVEHGAVSAECAAEMARGARRVFGTDVAVSVTGVAGPGGATPDKPIGLVWFGISSSAAERTEKAIFPGDRDAVRRQAIVHAIGMLTAEAAGGAARRAVPRVRGCVFDFGGVITSSRVPDGIRPAIDELSLPWSVVENGFAKYRSLMDGDEMTMEEMYIRIFTEAGVSIGPERLASIVAADRSSFFKRNERTLAWMRELKAQGFKIGILTNMPSSFGALFREKYADFVSVADALVVSGEEKMHKPQRRIYDLLAERIALPAEELCFFDDVEENCAGARAAGWRAIRFDSNAQAEEDFKELLRA